MKSIGFPILVILLFLFRGCGESSYTTSADSVILELHKKDPEKSMLMRLRVVSPDIIHVSAAPGNVFPADTSLIVFGDFPVPPWDLEKKGDNLELTTSGLAVTISLKTGELTFRDRAGDLLLQEQEGGGKTFSQPDELGFYRIQQVFESGKEEGLYGLGQYQNGEINLKGKNIHLFQHNIVAVNPFLVSTQRYGLLWDNYSVTRFGDDRDYKPLSEFTLKDNNGNPGGLTAIYMNSGDSTDIYTTRRENTIDYRYLDDLKTLPEEFSLENGKAVWEGTLTSAYQGEHRFRVFSSGYAKVWIDHKLVHDNWRQGWNPWYSKHSVMLEDGREVPVRIEWIPASGQSFLAMDWLESLPRSEQDKIRFSSEAGKSIEYYFVHGETPDRIISGYRKLTGKAPVVPEWAMGLWQSRERYRTQQELLNVVKEFRERKIPLDNIVLDWFYWPENAWGDHLFDSLRFPDPAGMVQHLHDRYHAHIMISVWPKFYSNTENYKFMERRGWVYPENVKNSQEDWVGHVSTFYDAFNPDARKFYWQGIRDRLWSKGFDAWWMDATEPDILSNTSNEQRKKLMSPLFTGPSEAFYNAYSLVHSKGVYEGLRKDDPGHRVFILTRSAFAGQQRYGAATWSGDVAARWDDLEAQIPAGLNFCMAGIPYWTTDIGGFSVERRYEHASGDDLEEWRELMTRWYQFGTFCPLMRVHGQYPYREIFNVAPPSHPAYRSMLYYDRLRYRMLPYNYSLAGRVYHDDYTIMRGLIMDFSEDPETHEIADQYMFGPSIMVAPVYKHGVAARRVYLPAGQGWYNAYTGAYSTGGQWIETDAPYTRIPLFAREGSILLYGPDLQYVSEKPADVIDILIYTGKDATFTLYEDEGVNYHYEKGAYTIIPLAYMEEEGVLHIGERTGSFPGMLEEREFRVSFISREAPAGIDQYPSDPLVIRYKGQEIQVKKP